MNFGEIFKSTIILLLLLELFRFCLYRTMIGRIILRILRTIVSFVKFTIKDTKSLYRKGKRFYKAREKKQQAKQASYSDNVIHFRKRA